MEELPPPICLFIRSAICISADPWSFVLQVVIQHCHDLVTQGSLSGPLEVGACPLDMPIHFSSAVLLAGTTV